MKRHQIHTVIENRSAYPIDIVWENAQDLEHVSRLHPNTNAFFELLATHRSPNSPFEYDILIYRAVRKVAFFRIHAFGFRRIVGTYNLQQFEFIPMLQTKSMLNSLLYPSTDTRTPTRMVDEVILEVPSWLAPFEKKIIQRLRTHAATQCQEDEPFRERRVLLSQKGIHRPFRIFSVAEMERLASQFQLNLKSPLPSEPLDAMHLASLSLVGNRPI